MYVASRTSALYSLISREMASRSSSIVFRLSTCSHFSKGAGHDGSSVSSWYVSTYGCSSAWTTLYRASGSNATKCLSRSMAGGQFYGSPVSKRAMQNPPIGSAVGSILCRSLGSEKGKERIYVHA